MNGYVSVIVPVYNAEKYLSECVNSILNQSYEKFELILVDDGSKDRSGEICDKYASNDSRVKVIHKLNGGVSSARNAGLESAVGEYVTFVDADDFVDANLVSNLYHNAVKNNSDLVFCGFAIYTDGAIVPAIEFIPEFIDLSTDKKRLIDFASRFFNSKKYISSSACRILYKKRIIKDIRFDSNIKIGEDWMFLLHSITLAERVSSIDDILYYYRIHSASATHSYFKDYLNNQLSIMDVLKALFGKMEGAQGILPSYYAMLCYHFFTNEIKNPNGICRENIKVARKSELYRYFKLRTFFSVQGATKKIKYLLIWILVKLRFV